MSARYKVHPGVVRFWSTDNPQDMQDTDEFILCTDCLVERGLLPSHPGVRRLSDTGASGLMMACRACGAVVDDVVQEVTWLDRFIRWLGRR